ncbi:MAG: type II secretion system F family protein [Myxococcales bacterium]
MGNLVPDTLGLLASACAFLLVAGIAFFVVRAYEQFQEEWLRAGGAGAVDARQSMLVGLLRKLALVPLSPLNARFVPARFYPRASGLLRRAGYPGELTPLEVAGLMELCALTLGGLAALLVAGLNLPVYVVPVAALIGAGYPFLWLRDLGKARQHQIIRALPYDLDLLTLSVEAGLDFAAAIGKVVEKGRKGPLCDELSIMLRELRLGKTREEALRNLAVRVEVTSVTTFVQALIHADRMGTPLGKVLRILSTEMRVVRTQRAEKLANEAPVKLLFPLIACIFPTIFLMLFAPIIYEVLYGGGM